MEQVYLKKYSELLLNYCLELKPTERIFIKSTIAAAPLVEQVYQLALELGAYPEVALLTAHQEQLLLCKGSKFALEYVSLLTLQALTEWETYLFIRAPMKQSAQYSVPDENRTIIQQALKSINEIYFQRTANGSLRRNLCQYPTDVAAANAGMTLEEYTEFVIQACYLNDASPESSWKQIRTNQQHIVDALNKASLIRYENARTDITFSVKDRIWINSDGRTNMPSGEVYTGPIEDSMNGHIYFDYGFMYAETWITGVTLFVQDGEIQKWEVEVGRDAFEKLMQVPGARRFGEVAIGTNARIQRITKNILYDEKIGGTIHMAVGQSYLQTGGKNQSSVHVDMIANMKEGGRIYTDGNCIYENGKFLLT